MSREKEFLEKFGWVRLSSHWRGMVNIVRWRDPKTGATGNQRWAVDRQKMRNLFRKGAQK